MWKLQTLYLKFQIKKGNKFTQWERIMDKNNTVIHIYKQELWALNIE